MITDTLVPSARNAHQNFRDQIFSSFEKAHLASYSKFELDFVHRKQLIRLIEKTYVGFVTFSKSKKLHKFLFSDLRLKSGVLNLFSPVYPMPAS